MMDSALLSILRCPDTRQPVRLAQPAELDAINKRIATGGVQNRGGKPVTEALAAALIREDRALVYPVRNNIPVMLIDEGIPLTL